MSEEVLQSNEIIFNEVLDITQVMEYYEQFNRLLNSHKEITLNAEKVERVDGAALQLLLAFVKEAAKLNVSVVWSGVSGSFVTCARYIALEDELGYPST